MTLQQLDRWLLNVIFQRSRIFKVRLADCCDEFGNNFGVSGSHFFVRALAQGENIEAVCAYLRSYYAAHPIRSFNQVIGHEISDPAGDQYFCPWEAARVRPLAKFADSHKVGPTSNETLERIAQRLLGVLTDIRTQGFRQFLIFDGFPRVIAIVDRAGRRRYIMRDGQHRAAAISHLDYETLWVTYEADHWTPSLVCRMPARLAGKSRFEDTTPRVVREDAVGDWPHVRAGRITRDEALAYFHALFGDIRMVAE
jgi:hypothetical protein